MFYYFVRYYEIKCVLKSTFAFLTISSVVLYLHVLLTDPVYIYSTAQQWELNFFVLLVRGACCLGFVMAYYVTETLTPVSVLGTTFACTNIVSRIITVLAPISADLMANPMLLSATFAAIAFLASFFIDSSNGKDYLIDHKDEKNFEEKPLEISIS